MMKTVAALIVAGGLLSASLVGGCSQMPTEKQSIADMRPQISFKVGDERVLGARVILDGLDMGLVGDYVEGFAALRVLSGTHMLSVAMENQIIFKEKFYVGDGVSRTFVLK